MTRFILRMQKPSALRLMARLERQGEKCELIPARVGASRLWIIKVEGARP